MHATETQRDEKTDRGQAALLMLAVAALLAVMMITMGRVGARLVAIQQARAAADAAALAGVVDGRSAAATLAARNGGSLITFRQLGDDVVVVVQVRGAVATARASRAP